MQHFEVYCIIEFLNDGKLTSLGVPAILWLICSPKLVETPRFTLLERGDREQAESDLRKLRACDVKCELDEMEESKADQSDNGEQMSVGQLFTTQSVRWQITIIIVSQMAQQLSGTVFHKLPKIPVLRLN